MIPDVILRCTEVSAAVHAEGALFSLEEAVNEARAVGTSTAERPEDDQGNGPPRA